MSGTRETSISSETWGNAVKLKCLTLSEIMMRTALNEASKLELFFQILQMLIKPFLPESCSMSRTEQAIYAACQSEPRLSQEIRDIIGAKSRLEQFESIQKLIHDTCESNLRSERSQRELAERIQQAIDEAISLKLALRTQKMLDALQSGKDFPEDPWWPQLLFPIPSRETAVKHERSTMHRCKEILEHEQMGEIIGQAVQLFLNLPPDAAVQILSACEGRWKWILHWMQLFDRVLSIDGVEEDPTARNACTEGLRKLESLAERAPSRVIRATFEWKVSEAGYRPCRRTDVKRWDERRRESKESPFCRGVRKAIMKQEKSRA